MSETQPGIRPPADWPPAGHLTCWRARAQSPAWPAGALPQAAPESPLTSP